MKKILAAAVAVLFCLLALCGCGKTALYGTWQQSGVARVTDEPLTLLSFYDNGTGQVAKGETVSWLTYSVKRDTVTVTLNEVGAEPTAYTFKVEGEQLTLTDEGGTTVTLLRQESFVDDEGAAGAAS